MKLDAFMRIDNTDKGRKTTDEREENRLIEGLF